MARFDRLELVSLDVDGRPPRTGVATAAGVVDLDRALAAAGNAAPPGLTARPIAILLAIHPDLADRLRDLLDHLDGTHRLAEVVVPAPDLAPPLHPGKVLAVGRNWADHARELGNEPPAEPFFFLKAPSIVAGPGAAIAIPADLPGEVHHEAELAVVIGRRGRRIPAARALEWVGGWTCANDVTARTVQRSLQERRLPWTAGKNVDTFLPLGPGVLLRDAVPDPTALRIRCLVDDEVRQDGRTADMVFGVHDLIAHASRYMTLDPGDVLLCGTPAGVGPLLPGQTVIVDIEGVGTLRNPVIAEPVAS